MFQLAYHVHPGSIWSVSKPAGIRREINPVACASKDIP